jgi:hypothetical protein
MPAAVKEAQMEIAGRPVEAAVFAVILGFLIGGIAVAFVYFFML